MDSMPGVPLQKARSLNIWVCPWFVLTLAFGAAKARVA